jgi:hypothetical protein
MLLQVQIPSAAQVDQALERVYARPELQPREPNAAADAADESRRQILGRIEEWFSHFGELRSENPIIYWLVIGALAAAGAAIVGYLLWNTFKRLEERGATPRPTTESGGVNARARTTAEWEEEARRAAAAGRYRDAAVALYQALLLRLEAAGALRYHPAKTPGDYRREARRDPRATGALTAFLRGFEPVAFGGRALDGEGYERLRAAAAGAGHG